MFSLLQPMVLWASPLQYSKDPLGFPNKRPPIAMVFKKVEISISLKFEVVFLNFGRRSNRYGRAHPNENACKTNYWLIRFRGARGEGLAKHHL